MTDDTRVLRLAAELLQLDIETLSAETRRADVPSWDSMQHLSLVMSVEQACGISLDFDQVLGIETLGDLMALAAHAPTP